jgi:hypothetical protein
MRCLGDVLQHPAQAWGYLVVAADSLNIFSVIADVEVVDG